MDYVYKKCTNCSLKLKRLCYGKDKFCNKWLPKKTSCASCLRLRLCISDSKNVSEKTVCEDYIRDKNPTSIREVKESVLTEQEDLTENDNDFFSPVNLIENIIKSDYDPKVFDELDDSDIKRPENEIEFIIDPEFMGISLFPMQLFTILNYFSSYCPFCSDLRFLRKVKVDTNVDDIIDHVVLYNKLGVCPKCKISKYEAHKKGKLKCYNQMIGVAGQRSGKSGQTAIIAAAITMKYLLLPDYATFFPGLLKGQELQGTFVSLTFGQAFDNLWTPYYKFLTETKWFKEYFRFFQEEGERLGKELVKLRDTFVNFSFKGLSFYPSGPDKRKLRGKTRVVASIDEVAWFIGGKDAVKFNPDEIYEALDNSLMTILSASRRVFPKHPYTPTAYGIYISSPSSKTDMAMRMYQQSRFSDTIYGFKKATWEYNPHITKRDLSAKFSNDPIAAERDFGANPPHSSSPFISAPSAVVPCFTGKSNVFKLGRMRTIKDSLGGKLLSPSLKINRLHTYPSVLGVDAGFKFNSFGLVLQHWNTEKEAVEVSGIIELRPDPYPLSYPDIYENIISPIIESFNVKMVVTDRWQSIDITQRTYKDFNVDAMTHTLKYPDFDDIRSRVVSNEYIFPKTERSIKQLINIEKTVLELIDASPVSHLFLQLLMIKDTGRTVTKGDDIDDDIFRAMSIGTSIITNEDYAHLFDGSGYDLMSNKKASDLCVVITKSGGFEANMSTNSGVGVLIKSSG